MMGEDRKIRLALFASGSGTNAERIIHHFESDPDIKVVMLLSNRPDAYALVRATQHGIPTTVFTREAFEDGSVTAILSGAGITHLVLAGFLWLVPSTLIARYANRIINIHPALLPAFGGKGMYGMKVHEAVKASGANETGITIHQVNERYDEGQILFQASCPVIPSDSPDDIASKVHALEYAHYPRVIGDWVRSH